MEDSVEYADAQVLFDTGLSLVCLVDGIRVRVPTFLIQAGSEVGRNGDRGKLVIAKSLALSIGLALERGEVSASFVPTISLTGDLRPGQGTLASSRNC